ncbi:hypothetical protein ACWDBW_14455 [Streptomyces sp. NPDC001107]
MDPAAVSPLPAGVSLRRLLMSLGDSLVEVQAAPAGLDVEIQGVALLDPEDPPTAQPGELVLAIGARGRAARPVLRAAGRDGAAAVLVEPAGAGRAAALSETAAEAGVALLSLRGEARWEQVNAPARAALDDAPPGEYEAAAEEGDLFSLVQTTALLTGGIGSASRTPPTGCWPTRAPPTPTRSTTCGGVPSSAGRALRRIWRSCASGACSSTCTPATR